MAVKKRGKKWHLKMRVFGKEIGLSTHCKYKSEAQAIEMAVITACRSGDYRSLDAASRELCVRMFENQGWECPRDLKPQEEVKETLTLWKAIELCLKYPDVRTSPNRGRHEQSFVHLVEKWGKDFPVLSLWIPHIKEYQIVRLDEGAAPSTVNKEKAALSKMFQVLLELRYVDVNPARLVKNLSERSGQRQVYLSYSDFCEILAYLPEWFRPIALTAYYTGMRRGEVVGLRRRQLNLHRRMIYLGADDVKERQTKRVPIHRQLVPVLDGVLRIHAIDSDYVFLKEGRPVVEKTQLRWCWDRRVSKLHLDPPPRFHDLRHTWKTNARRSGMHPEIEQAIMGHSQRGMGVHERYGRIGDQELIQAIDLLTFDHGETEIVVPRRDATRGRSHPGQKCGDKMGTKNLQAKRVAM